MALFLSKFINKVDKKGRVSVPSNFRTILNDEKFSGVVVYKSFLNNCIEGSGLKRIEHLYGLIDELEPFSEERDILATSILGGSIQLPFDPEGRVFLPEELISGCQLTNKACFVGKGETFEIWNPDLFSEYQEKVLELAKAKRSLLHLKSKKDIK